MPVEIRELIIKTEITAAGKPEGKAARDKELASMKRKLLDECKRLIALGIKKDYHKR